ncbi:pentatricopeptide repeat-containing protein At3g26630, chloroplastic-like [Tasmannia lanceolata]|uniref:pentatricopeptide repeat-containing protein At3g26630, chloroplastic-like n=1 Tax=Tasmannia lanceolata TaxID=3420 RepID=UPI0040640E1D
MVACPATTTVDALHHNHLLISRQSISESREGLLIFQKCGSIKHLKQIHAHLLRTGLAHNPILVTKLLTLCSSYRKLQYATLIFNQMQNPPTFTWNVMIRAHTRNGSPTFALLLYTLMLNRGVPPDKFTFPFVIKACLNSFSVKEGKQVHAHVVKSQFAGDIFVQNTLMDLYLKCGDLEFARLMFDKMRVRNVVSWTTMVSGLVFCGELETASAIFEAMSVRNVVSWTTMVNGYARNGRIQEAFELFRRMQLENVRPNEFTLVSLLLACTEVGSLRLGSWIHEFARKNGFEMGIFLGTALIDMYSKCGSIDDAIKVFDQMPMRSLVTWNSMITSLGVHGRGNKAIALFGEMEKAKVKPDEITFIGVLSACVNECMVDKGYGFFINMTKHYGIKPTVGHYVCMVDLLGRAGMLDEAYELVKNMTVEPHVDVWGALLRACKTNGNIKLEEVVYKHILELDSSKEGHVICNSAQQQLQCFGWEVG